MNNSIGKPETWLKILYWSLVIAGCWFAFLNIQPYQQAVIYASGGLNRSLLGIGVSWIIGAAVWLVIQIIEVLPLVLFNHSGFLSFFIGAASSHQKYQINEEDDPTLKLLKKTYNTLPTSVVSNMEILKIFTYTVDFCICLTVYSPVRSGRFTDFVFLLATGQWNKILWGNVVLALITLFSIEVIVSLIIWVGKMAFAFKQVKASQYD